MKTLCRQISFFRFAHNRRTLCTIQHEFNGNGYQSKNRNFEKQIAVHELKEQREPLNKEIQVQWDKNGSLNDFLSFLKEKLNLKSFQDWNLLTQKQIKENGGENLLNYYSMYEIKCLGFPEGKYQFTKPISYKSKGYWKKEINVRNFLEKLKEKLNLQTIDSWNSITVKDIYQNGGDGLLHFYSMYELKSIGCPEGKNVFSESKSQGFWNNQQNIENFIQVIKERLQLNTPEDWNSITSNQVIEIGGSSLLKQLTLFELKCFGCPEGKLLFSQKNSESKGYWDKMENIQEFITKLKENLNIKSPEDWNLITSDQIKSFGGTTLLNKYSLYGIKVLGCPEGKNLFSTRKKRKSSNFWDKNENIDEFIENLRDQLSLKSFEDWNRISVSQIRSLGGSSLLKNISITDIKCLGFPEGKEEFIKGNNNTNLNLENKLGKRSSQRWLFLQVQKLFPGEEIVEDYFHSELSRESGFSVQFDIYLIERKIAFEYHGGQHYIDLPEAFSSLEMYKLRDKEKEILCLKYGIKLIVIPYWWNNSLESLRATIDSVL